MSFGVSVGDILLVSQLAYRLYGALSTGRRSAGKEFENALFSLRCALDHLGKQAEDIAAKAADNGGQHAANLRNNLDVMISSCGATLMELENILVKYADDVDDADSVIQQPTVSTARMATKKLSLLQLKKTVKVNWLKVLWDLEGKTLMEYRQKLETHTDAINLVLNTFLW